MEEPLIKGVVLLRSWGQLHEMMEVGSLSRDDLEQRLSARDLGILDEKLEPTLWYPLETVTSFGDILSELTGREGPDEWIARGRAIAANILGNPNMAVFFDKARAHTESVGDTMVRISSLLINFGEMSFEGDLTDFRVIWKEVGPLPDLVRYAVQGVVVEFACRVIDGPVTVTSERDSVEGTIVYSGAPG